MRQAHIFYKDLLAGILTENDAGYEFHYLPEYFGSETSKLKLRIGDAFFSQYDCKPRIGKIDFCAVQKQNNAIFAIIGVR